MLNKIFSKIYRLLERSHYKDIYDGYRKSYSIDSGFKFNGKNIEFYGDGQIIAGKNSYIGNNSAIQAAANSRVVIGDRVAISHNVRIYTCNRVAKFVCGLCTDDPIQYETSDVIIGNNVWIGANVLILQGTTIADNVVIGANSVIKGKFKSGVIVAPARPLS